MSLDSSLLSDKILRMESLRLRLGLESSPVFDFKNDVHSSERWFVGRDLDSDFNFSVDSGPLDLIPQKKFFPDFRRLMFLLL